MLHWLNEKVLDQTQAGTADRSNALAAATAERVNTELESLEEKQQKLHDYSATFSARFNDILSSKPGGSTEKLDKVIAFGSEILRQIALQRKLATAMLEMMKIGNPGLPEITDDSLQVGSETLLIRRLELTDARLVIQREETMSQLSRLRLIKSSLTV